jgi:3-oxoacyl-ACP reductase-like protein
MGIFSSIMDKIFHRKPTAPPPTAAPAPTPTQAAPTPAPAPAAPIDVEAVLTALAEQKGRGGNWRTSIVDLLKLLDLDSSLAARTELGQELSVKAGPDGSAEQNIALQKAVWKHLAENGGHVSASLKE